jgi:mannitol-1-/sugar-/sorbitol-6-phosphatase
VIISCHAILFDLDGVLVDSTPAVARVWTRWALAHGLAPELVVAQAHGRRSIETIRAVAPHMNAELENVKVEQLEIEDREGVRALPGAAEIVQAVPSARMAIVTSATRALAVARMGYAGLPIPQNMITSENVVQGKPFPEPYVKGARLLGFAPEDCVVVEDTPAGIGSGKKAGMRVVAVQTTYSATELQAATVITQSLAQVRLKSLNPSLSLDVHPLFSANDYSAND